MGKFHHFPALAARRSAARLSSATALVRSASAGRKIARLILWPSLPIEALLVFFLTVPANSELHKVVFPSARTLAHLALAAAASLALTAGLLRRSFFLAAFGVAVSPLTSAHLACWAAAILARTAADLRCFFVGSTEDGDGISPPPPAMESIWPWRASICSLMAMMRWSWLVVKFARLIISD